MYSYPKALETGKLYLAVKADIDNYNDKDFYININFAKEENAVITKPYYIYMVSNFTKSCRRIYSLPTDFSSNDNYIVRFEDVTYYNGEEGVYRYYFGFKTDYLRVNIEDRFDIFDGESNHVYIFMSMDEEPVVEEKDMINYPNVKLTYTVNDNSISFAV